MHGTAPDPIADLHQGTTDVSRMLLAKGDTSLATMLTDHLRKTLILACASRFEREIQRVIQDLVEATDSPDPRVVSLVRRRVIERQYHTYFAWESSNANSFFAMFGSDFKEAAKKRVASDQDLAKAIVAFLEIGRLRNQIVHEDFVAFPIEKTADEVFAAYQQAGGFVEFLRDSLRPTETDVGGDGVNP